MKVAPSVADGVLLVGAGVSFGIAVERRNAYADNQLPGTKRAATVALNTGVGLVVALAVVRVASALGYGWGFSMPAQEGERR